jgi:hypothetical protein
LCEPLIPLCQQLIPLCGIPWALAVRHPPLSTVYLCSKSWHEHATLTFYDSPHSLRTLFADSAYIWQHYIEMLYQIFPYIYALQTSSSRCSLENFLKLSWNLARTQII